MAIRRGSRPADRFTIVANAALEDSRLSWRARGILAYMLGRPEGWKTSADRLMKQGTEGRDAVRTALSELESLGYLVRTKVQDARGRWGTDLIVHDSPVEAEGDSRIVGSPEETGIVGSPEDLGSKIGGSPGVGEPAVGSPAVGGPGAITKKEEQEGQQDTPSTPPSPSSYREPYKGGGMQRSRLPWYPLPESVTLAKATYDWATDVVLREVTGEFIHWITVKAKQRATIAQLNEDKEKYSGIWFSTFLAKESENRERAAREEEAKRELTREERIARRRAELGKVAD